LVASLLSLRFDLSPQSRDLHRFSHTASIFRMTRTSQRCELSWQILGRFLWHSRPSLRLLCNGLPRSKSIHSRGPLLRKFLSFARNFADYDGLRLCCVYDDFKIEESGDPISCIAPNYSLVPIPIIMLICIRMASPSLNFSSHEGRLPNWQRTNC
jgi:hypothetical protein